MGVGRFTPLDPVRAIDTRESSIVAGRGELTVPVAGVGGVPTGGVASVVVNLTITGAQDAGYLTAWAGGSRPGTSNLNFVRGDTVAATAVVGVGADGAIRVFNGSPKSVHVIVDVMGWWSDGGSGGSGYKALSPVRLLDSREASFGAPNPVPGGQILPVQVRGKNGVPSSATGALVNITVADPSSGSFVTAFPHGADVPGTSTLNFAAGQVRANMAAVKLGADGAIGLRLHSGTVALIVDLLGYFDPGVAGGFTPVTPVRAYDSRQYDGGDPMGDDEVLDLPFHWLDEVPSSARAVAANITLTGATSATYVSTYPSGGPPPTVSTVNIAPRDGEPFLAVCNNTFLTLDGFGYGSVRHFRGRTDVIVDVVGYLT